MYTKLLKRLDNPYPDPWCCSACQNGRGVSMCPNPLTGHNTCWRLKPMGGTYFAKSKTNRLRADWETFRINGRAWPGSSRQRSLSRWVPISSRTEQGRTRQRDSPRRGSRKWRKGLTQTCQGPFGSPIRSGLVRRIVTVRIVGSYDSGLWIGR